MAGSAVVAAKKALIAGLAADPNLDGVEVTYAWKRGSKKRERIFCGRAQATQEPASLKSGRTFRDERMIFDVTVVVEMPGGSAEAVEERAIELGTIVEEWVADNRTLDGVTGLNWAVVTGLDLTSMFNDNGHLAELVLQVTYSARLT